ncbi:alpha-mannosidase [Paenibacillus endophyticus]|uniref:alpha-mannosidase n=1 Tax=Paenibacillus endophyticus TaxID=1294268 RepID=A0A7W5C777_9BACL|nr:alpha-mannosidase [Paenibacillus endophyticus]MBB3152368.1 alpha-mannosidase [Paenibacillus endophyticus]
MHRINRFLKKLAGMQWKEAIPLPNWEMRKARYIVPGVYEYESDDFFVQTMDPLNSAQGVTYFLRKQLEIPSAWLGDPIGLFVEGGGEGMLKVNGVPYHGLDRNHMFVPLHMEGVGLNPLIEIELYDPIPEPVDPLNAQATIAPPIAYIRIQLVRVNKPMQSLMYGMKAVCESVWLLPEQDLKRLRLQDALYETMDETERRLDNGSLDGERLHGLEERLAKQVKAFAPAQGVNGKMHMVGQSHIDVAWLWPVRETVRKVSRTFSTMNTLMQEYPNFVYSQSQPLLYAFAKEHYPELYEQIKLRVAEGRWELVGGMWVEPDLNIPSGESLVRQILYGQLFYKEEFGKTSSIEWLPDTFGYCASLPQLLKLAGVDYFMTTKLNWNDTNRFPYDLFHWVGIDGTSVLSYLNHGLNEHTRPKDVHEHWEAYRHKDKLDELMLLYGHGDGGGGVTREMVEFTQRSEMMVELPSSHFSTAAEFFERAWEKRDDLPKWHGDLYLELHRGTYTTHARNKRSNRKAEVLYREAEIWSSLARDAFQPGQAEPVQAMLHEGWKLILLNQFHDIIPGTAIPETYVTSAEEYERVFKLGEACLEQSLTALTRRIHAQDEGKPYFVFNSLGWDRNAVVSIELNGEHKQLSAFDEDGNLLDSNLLHHCGSATLDISVKSIPAFGYTTVWLRPAPLAGTEGVTDPRELGDSWETSHYAIAFNAQGEIIRWFDKSAGRELILTGEKANEFQLFFDKPLIWDAWDIDPRFEAQRADSVQLLSKEVVVQGKAQDVLRFKWQIGQSFIEQHIIFYHDKKRVDFKTNVDWKEEHKLLKVAFPVDVVASKATYEIPFGALERPTHTNTSWEQAQYEVCGHRFADLSEGNYGVSLLNDCKYGYDIKESTMRLSLLRAPRWPDLTADQGDHVFTYSLYPHEQDWRSAHVLRNAMELNHPVRVMEGHVDAAAETNGRSQAGVLPSRQQLVRFESNHVILDTIKAAEQGVGTIFRLYESTGAREQIALRLPLAAREAAVVNLLEQELYQLDIQDGVVQLSFKPFEIVSIRVQ